MVIVAPLCAQRLFPHDPYKLVSLWYPGAFAFSWFFTPGSPGWIWSSLCSLLEPVVSSVFLGLENFLCCFPISSFSAESCLLHLQTVLAGDGPTLVPRSPVSTRPVTRHTCITHAAIPLEAFWLSAPFLRVIPPVSGVMLRFSCSWDFFHHLSGFTPLLLS